MSTPDSIALAPVSRPVAKLLHQLQAEIIKEANRRPVAPEALILVPPGKLESVKVITRTDGSAVVLMFNQDDYTGINFTREHVGDPKYAYHWAHGRWWCNDERRDENGQRWTGGYGTYVQDDFGYLVPVAR